MRLTCIECGHEQARDLGRYRCAKCGGLLEVTSDLRWAPSGRGVWRWRTMLPDLAGEEPVTLGEGATPLVECARLAEWVGVRRLSAKVEGQNPTGSFKDRGMAVGVTLARSAGAKLLLCASTGNTSASLAAYAVRAGLRAAVLVPVGKIARGKLAQVVAFGARVVEVDGTFDEALRAAESLATDGVLLMNSVNPYRLEGQKTLVFEILEDLAGAPDVLVYPYGNGGNVSAGWKALREARALGVTERAPRLLACEAEDRPRTLATAIRIGAAVNAPKAERAIRDSGGARIRVSDEAIVEAQRALAHMEGLFVEPASAASVAGLRRAVRDGSVAADGHAVVVLTGNGLKDTDAVERFGMGTVKSKADVESLRRALA